MALAHFVKPRLNFTLKDQMPEEEKKVWIGLDLADAVAVLRDASSSNGCVGVCGPYLHGGKLRYEASLTIGGKKQRAHFAELQDAIAYRKKLEREAFAR